MSDDEKFSTVGRRIVLERAMTPEELEGEGWDDRHGWALVLDNGNVLYASKDDEGNGPGAIFGVTPKGERFQIP
jgi:hypothetical protein